MAEENLRDMQVDRMVQSRLTEIFASSGIGTDRAALELLYLMPQDFVRAYEELFERALKLGGQSASGALKSAAELGKADSGNSGNRGEVAQLSGGAGKKYKKYWVVKDDRALDIKNTLDKRLRRIARGIRADLAGVEDQGRVGCSRCGKMMADGWAFCPGCGQFKE